MYALLSRHFDGVTREQFERDLAEKNWVVEIRRDGRLLGFSTLLVSEAHLDGRALTGEAAGAEGALGPSFQRSSRMMRPSGRLTTT